MRYDATGYIASALKLEPKTDLANSDREFFWPSALWVVTVTLFGRQVMAYAKIMYIQAVIVESRLAMSRIEHALRSAFDWSLFPV